MGLGIVEPHSGDAPAHVPGTVTLLRSDQETLQGTSKDPIILVPNPSQSPRDPLVGAARRYRIIEFTYA